MGRWRLDLEYDGLGFAGWQVQPGQRTVQGVLEEALHGFLGDPVRLHGAGRTDSGVSALQQVAMFETEVRRDARGVREGLNSRLPEDVAVVSAGECAPRFHPRHTPHRKTYCYTWVVRPGRPVFGRHRCWHVRSPMDVAAMDVSVRQLLGTHDVAAFRASHCNATHTIRTMEAASVTQEGEHVRLRVQGTGFLMHQVRIMAGTLYKIGRGSRTPEWFAEVVASRDRGRAGETAPAYGLMLERIDYDE
jgi:tRNA pseudouridine38-40 synthase